MEQSAGKYRTDKMSAMERITVFAMVTAPFTSLRFSFFGLSEIAFIIVFISVLLRNRMKIRLEKDNLSKYFLVFVVASVFGWVYNMLFADLGTVKSAVYNFAAYLFTLFAVVSAEHLSCGGNPRFRPEKILFSFFIWFSAISAVLFIISRFRETIFGFRLIYFGLFSPLSDNIHQLAMTASPLPFIGLYMARKSRTAAAKLIIVILSVLDVIIVSSTGSFKAGLGMLSGAFLLFVMLIFTSKKLNRLSRNVILFVAFTAVLVLIIIKFDSLGRYVQRIFAENDNSGERGSLYSQSLKLILRYPIFGLGPSAVLSYGRSFFDAHETVFTAGLSAGIFGIVSIVIILYKCIKTLIRHPFYFSAFIPILIYALGGDILRKSAIWVCIVLMISSVKSENTESQAQPSTLEEAEGVS